MSKGTANGSPSIAADVAPPQPSLPSPPVNRPSLRTLTAGLIPIEILLEILPKLAQPDLAHMLRVSCAVHSVTLPFLYTDLTIDLNQTHNPITSGGVVISPVKPAKPSPSQTQLPLPDRFSYTKHLTIVTHDRSTCCKLPNLHMPNLISLRVQPAGREDHLDLCTNSTKSLDLPPYLPLADYTPCCQLVASLQPKRLILGDCTTGLTGSARGLWPSARGSLYPGPFPPSCREIITLVGMVTGFEGHCRKSPSFLDHPPRSVRKVTFVQSCADEGWEKLSTQDGGLHPLEDPAAVEWAVVLQCAKISCDIEIVTIQEVNQDGRPSEETRAGQALLRSHLEGVLLRGRDGDAETKVEAARRAKAVGFVDDHGFRKRESWYPAVAAASLEAAMEKVKQRVT